MQPVTNALTRQQTAVLALIASGSTTKAAAAKLHIDPETVDFHISQAKERLGAESRTHACVLAVRRGLI